QLRSMSMAEGRRLLEDEHQQVACNAVWDRENQRFTIPVMRLKIVGHFLPADFTRIFGAYFYRDTLGLDRGGAGALTIADRKLLGLHNPNQPYTGTPLVEYATTPSGEMFEVRLEFCDTNLPYGNASLDKLAATGRRQA